MESMIIHPKNKDQAKLFEQLAKVLDVPFEKSIKPRLSEREKAIKRYGKEIVEKVEQGEKAFKEGKMTEKSAVNKQNVKDLPIRFSDKPDANALSGIWKDKPVTIEELRKKAWGDRL